jgi:predicted ATP-dependent endonuclease of OLD family
MPDMTIERVIVKNYKALQNTDVELTPDINIIVGDNETGKSTLLEAINLALSCQINRRSATYELHPFLFNTESVKSFITKVKAGQTARPIEIVIELYFRDDPAWADLKGSNNSLMTNQPGVSLSIQLDDNFAEEYAQYIADKDRLSTIPVEYYHVVWMSFASHPLSTREMPIKPALIDPSSITNSYAANRYVLEIARDFLTRSQQVSLALSYRKLREVFQDEANVAAINKELEKKKGVVSDRRLSVALDMTTKASWETSILPHLDDLPMTLVGKGEQNAVKIKLAMEAAEGCHVILIEEPENHLSHTNLNRLISQLVAKSGGKQLVVSTHSSFVLNKLGIDNTQMFNGSTAITLSDLPPSTKSYFKKLPGHETLRMVLARRTILVEGPSDELIVQKAFHQTHGRMPLDAGVEVITVNSLAFKRFLDIARLLSLDVRVVTDNDGDPAAIERKYADYADVPSVKICFSTNAALSTLELHLLGLNGRAKLNRLLGKTLADDKSLLDYMLKNKTETAMVLFDSTEEIEIPDYIANAVG